MIVPVREAPVPFELRSYRTVPLPVPLADVMVIQEAAVVAVQPHVAVVVTEKVLLLCAPLGKEALVGEMA
jgi:hypothetical protein